MNRPDELSEMLSEILAELRRMLRALKGRIVPARPQPAPVRVHVRR